MLLLIIMDYSSLQLVLFHHIPDLQHIRFNFLRLKSLLNTYPNKNLGISPPCSLQLMLFYHIPDLRHIRHFFDRDSAKSLADSLESSYFDYGNSLLSCITETDLNKVQCVQNRLAHVVTKSATISAQYSTTAFPSLVTSNLELSSKSVC